MVLGRNRGSMIFSNLPGGKSVREKKYGWGSESGETQAAAALPPVVAALAGKRGSPDAGGKAAAAWVSPDSLPHPYFFSRTLFPPGRLEKIIEPRFRPSTISLDGVTLEPTWLGWLERAADEARRLEAVGGVSWLEMRSYMASTLLRDTDSVSMAQSLEVRLPLLDTPLVE